MNFGIEVGHDEILELRVVWNESATFRVFDEAFDEEVDVFTVYDVKSLDEAREAADNYLSRIYEEMMDFHAA